MRRLIFGIGCLFSATLVAAPPRPFNLDDLALERDVSDPEVSPDGALVAYSVRTTDLKEDKHETHIWRTSWDGKETVRLTTGKESETTPRWSPDGRSLAFLSERGDENDATQLWILPRSGGEAEKLTELKGGVEDFDWSPDGKRLVLVVSDPDPEAPAEKEDAKKPKTKKPIVIDRFQFKLDGYGYLVERHKHLYLVDRDSRKVEPLTTGTYDELLPSWSPDGKTIAFVSKRGPDPDRTDNWDVFAIEARSGAAVRKLTSFEGSDNDPEWGDSRLAWSPDSKLIAYVQGGPDKLIYYGLHKLAVVPAAGGQETVLTPTLDLNVLSPRFTPDGKSILFMLEEDQAVHLAKIAVGGGPVERVVGGRRLISAFSTAAGHTVILSSTPQAPEEVYAAEAGQLRRISTQNDAWLAGIRLGAVEETSFKSKDGTEIHGFVVKPPDYQLGRRYPAVLRIHGGPVGQFELGFDEEWQWIAANGYVVIAANPRGSSGRGEKFQTAIYADWGHKDVEDVLGAVDDAISRGLVDPERMAVGGWSYGGMMTNYVIASTTRFKAATSGAGISNALTGYGTDQYIREYEQELGTPWKNIDAYIKVSFPFLHADRITTPTLFLCGDEDFNVPLHNSEQMYQALKSLGVQTELVIYPGQYHGIRKPTYQRDRLERYVAWYDKYAKAPKAAATAAPADAGAR